VPVECFPFHEIICFKNVGVLQSVSFSSHIERTVIVDLIHILITIPISLAFQSRH
jgi:hypothetical protein